MLPSGLNKFGLDFYDMKPETEHDIHFQNNILNMFWVPILEWAMWNLQPLFFKKVYPYLRPCRPEQA